MDQPLALVIFALLLGISLYGLVTSSRRARLNDASRHAGQPVIHPAEQFRRPDLHRG